MRSAALPAMLLLPLLAGCTGCTPQEVPAQVAIALHREEARSLPLLTSHATRVGGEAAVGVGPGEAGGVRTPPLAGGAALPSVEVPDSHGWLEFRLNVTSPNVTTVHITGFRFAVRVAGAEVPTKVLRVEGGQGWSKPGNGGWEGSASSGDVSRVWWAVDGGQLPSLASLALAAGAPYAATLDFTWEHRSCRFEAGPGHVTQELGGFVKAVANARAFEAAGEPEVEAQAAGVGFRARYHITNGLDVTLRNATARAVWLSGATKAAAGLVLFPQVTWLVNGQAGSQVTPADVVEVRSAASSSGAAYAASGIATPPALGAGLYLLEVELGYQAEQPTPGAALDTFAHAVAR